jgi:hypothetical protein
MAVFLAAWGLERVCESCRFKGLQDFAAKAGNRLAGRIGTNALVSVANSSRIRLQASQLKRLILAVIAATKLRPFKTSLKIQSAIEEL